MQFFNILAGLMATASFVTAQMPLCRDCPNSPVCTTSTHPQCWCNGIQCGTEQGSNEGSVAKPRCKDMCGEIDSRDRADWKQRNCFMNLQGREICACPPDQGKSGTCIESESDNELSGITSPCPRVNGDHRCFSKGHLVKWNFYNTRWEAVKKELVGCDVAADAYGDCVNGDRVINFESKQDQGTVQERQGQLNRLNDWYQQGVDKASR